MTRINLVPPTDLCDQHLLGEYHEICRVPRGVVTGRLQVHYDDRPACYTRGKGHMKFFTNKCAFVHGRFMLVVSEALKRGFAVSGRFPDVEDLQRMGAYNDWTPDVGDIILSRQWLIEKLPAAARWTPHQPKGPRHG